MIPVRSTKIDFPWRKSCRLVFKLCLIGLIVGSCTQSFTWLGEVTTGKSSSSKQTNYRYNDYDESCNTYHDRYHDNNSSTTRSSTRYNEYQQPIEENNEYEERQEVQLY